MPPRRSAADKARYFRLRQEGMRLTEAAREIGIQPKTARAWEKGMKDASGQSFFEKKQIASLAAPIPYEELDQIAKQGWDDFEFFRRAHFGRLSSPWQIDAAFKFQEALWTPHREFINLNCPPGSGKSTLLHDIEAWLTVRNRAIRGLVGSATQRLANRYAGRLKRSFEAIHPPMVDPAQVAAGRAYEPMRALVKSYGRFQPDQHDLWRQEEFVIAQFGDVSISEKEPTWQAYGLDTDYIGNRLEISVWDDVVTKRIMRTLEAIEKQRDNWDDQAESRIEPGGAIFLVGQRLGALDLYAYNKAKLVGLEDDEWEDEDDLDDPVDNYFEINPEGSQKKRKYHSLVYPAHDESKCKGKHSMKNPEYWAPDNDDNCLLDPVRIPWRDLRAIQAQSMDKYRVVYQQEDVDPASILVPRVYVTGGEHNGETLPGCYDTHRAYHEIPRGIAPETMSIVTVDMSPTNWWSVQWWLYDPTTELRYFMDMARHKMSADQFLDYNPDAEPAHRFTGVLEDMWQTSNRLGRPFKTLIIERNGAQRFLMQLEYFRRWNALRDVSYYPHDTGLNKSDDQYGVQILATHYRHGRYRLPNKQEKGDLGFIITRQLVDEVTVWPEGTTDDCVMAQWFLEWWIPRLSTFEIDIPDKWVPSYIKAGV